MLPTRPRSNIAPHILDDVAIPEIADFPVEDLADLSDALAQQKQVLERRAAALHAALVRRFGDRIQEALAAKGADTGTVHLGEDAYDVTVTTPKKVDWDQDLLRFALDELDPEDARHLAKVTITIEERKYTSALPKVRATLEPCRTVKPGKPTFKFTLKERSL